MLLQSTDKLRDIFQIRINQDKLADTLKAIVTKLDIMQARIHKIQVQEMERQDKTEKQTQKFRTIMSEELYCWNQRSQKLNSLMRTELDKIQQKRVKLENTVQRQLNYCLTKESPFIEDMKKQTHQQFLAVQKEMIEFGIKIREQQKVIKHQNQNDTLSVSKLRESMQRLNASYSMGIKKIQRFEQQMERMSNKINRNNSGSIFSLSAPIQKQKIVPKKSRYATRNSVNTPFFQKQKDIFDQSTSIEYLSLTKKVQNLQKLVSQHIHTRHQRNSNPPRYSSIQASKFASMKNGIQPEDESILSTARQNKKGQLQNKNYRSSIQAEEWNQEKLNIKQMCESYLQANTTQMKRINDKVRQMKLKLDLIEKNHEVVIKKMTKLSGIQATILSKASQIQKMRIDANTINQINIRFRQIQCSLQEYVSKSILPDKYQKDMSQLKQKFTQIDKAFTSTAKESETKSALMFLQTKIKELIVVLTNKFEQQKLGAINKIQNIRCLTCDRDADITINQSKRPETTSHSVNSRGINKEISFLKRKNPRATASYSKMRTETNQRVSVHVKF